MSRTRRFLALIVALTALVAVGALAEPAEADTGRRYLVLTRDARAVDDLLAGGGGSPVRATGAVERTFRGPVNGFATTLSAARAATLAADPRVTSVRPEHRYTAQQLDRDPPWGLDRIDQRKRTADGGYGYQTTGTGVTAYVVDSGIRLDHADFDGRAVSGWDLVDDDADASDCAGHGTHVAGIIGGHDHGVAKGVRLVSVRVLDCDGQGWEGRLIDGLLWVLDHRPAAEPAVVNLSFVGPPSDALDAAVHAVVAAGVSVIVAGGNYDPADPGQDPDACDFSPSRSADVIATGATTRTDARASFSRTGRCVDVYAPGEDILSDAATGPRDSELRSGTSMAGPHVAGAVARHLQSHPKATPAQVRAALLGDVTRTVTAVTGGPGPLLFVRRNELGSPASPRTTASRSKRTITLTWRPPADFGTWAVKAYELRRSGTDARRRAFTPLRVSSSARSYTFKGLRSDRTYTVSVRALNAAGASDASVRRLKLSTHS